MSLHLLSIGNDYPNTSSSLGGCVNDAHDVAAKFKPYCLTTKTILNNKADRAGILKEGKIFLDRLKKGDLGILSISGHGTRERKSRGYNEAIVTAGFDLIWDTELGEMLKKREAGSVLAVLADVCHAGGLTRGVTSGLVRVPDPTKKRRAMSIAMCNRHEREAGPTMGTLPDIIPYLACLPEQYAWDAQFDGRGNGAMTYYGMKSVDLKPTETFGKIFKKLAGKRPKGYLPNDDYDQQPVCVASAKNLKRTLWEFRKA